MSLEYTPKGNSLLPSQLLKVAVLTLKSVDHNTNLVYFWTDSTTVLKWISSVVDHHKNFVASRIEKIHKVEQYFHEVNWRYCPIKLNPADLAPLGLIMTHKNLEKLNWLTGSSFLVVPDQWATDIIHDDLLKTIAEDDLEL